MNTDANGKFDLSIVGTRTYTVTLIAANNSSVTTTGYVAFLGNKGLLTPNAVGGSGYSANISNISSAAGEVPMTFTLPLNSSGAVQANTDVTFEVYNGTSGSAFLSTTTGAHFGNGKTYSTYSNAHGQATVYVNDYAADSIDEALAVVGGKAVASVG